MDVIDIPFNRFIGISQSDDSVDGLSLVFRDDLKNHIGTFHASTQFSIAEASSGQALQTMFPHLADSVVPVLRKSETKFKKVAQSNLRARASVTDEAKERFERRFHKKGRAVIPVAVDVVDADENITMSGVFEWFIQKISAESS